MTEVWKNDNDGFVGVVIGHYVTREGEHGSVLQQLGTKVVHVYRNKWIRQLTVADTMQMGITTGYQDCGA